MKNIRKNALVRYIGSKEYAQGKTFRVLHKSGNFVEVLFPIRYGNGEIHNEKQYIRIEDVELA